MAKRAIYAGALERVTRAEGLLSSVREAEAALAEAREALSSLLDDDCEAGEEPLKEEDGKAPETVARSLPAPLLVDQVIIDALAGEDTAQVDADDGIPAGESDPDLEEDGPPPTLDFSDKKTPRKSLTIKPPSGCKMPILRPEGSFRLSWDTLGMFFILSEFYMIPFNIAFDIEPLGWMYGFVSLINVYFIADVVLMFFTGYKSDMGVLVMVPSRIAKRYLKGLFFPDFVSSIPWEWLPMRTKVGQLTKMLRMIRLLRVARILRLLRLGLMSEKVKLAIEFNPALTFAAGLVKVIFLLVSLTHMTACMWYIVGTRFDAPETWVNKFMTADEDTMTRYIHSLYFSLTTMTTVGYGDVTPQNSYERHFTLLLLLVASIAFAMIMGALTDLIGSMNTESHAMQEKMQMLGQYMRWRNMPPSLFMAVRKHLHYLWETNNKYDTYEYDVKQQLTPVLKKELCYHIYGRVLQTAPFFAWAWDFEVVLKELATLVEPMIFSKGDTIFRVGQPNTQVYLLLSGTVFLSLNESLSQMNGREEEQEEEELHDESSLLAHGGVSRDSDHHEMPASKVASLLKSRKAASDALDRMSSMSLLRARTAEKPQPQLPAEPARTNAHVLENARIVLEEDDGKVKKAARLIQRKWKKKKADAPQGKKDNKQKKAAHMHSRKVTAPAYFGESCLWVPFAEWDNTQTPYVYNVRCESRVELVYISRDTVKKVIDKFHPWLADRFEFFREAVVDGIAKVHNVNDNTDGCESQLQGLANVASDSILSEGAAPNTDDLLASLRNRAAEIAVRSRAAASQLDGTYVHGGYRAPSIDKLPGLGYASGNLPTDKGTPAAPPQSDLGAPAMPTNRPRPGGNGLPSFGTPAATRTWKIGVARHAGARGRPGISLGGRPRGHGGAGEGHEPLLGPTRPPQ